jgi:hypothetical protein
MQTEAQALYTGHGRCLHLKRRNIPAGGVFYEITTVIQFMVTISDNPCLLVVGTTGLRFKTSSDYYISHYKGTAPIQIRFLWKPIAQVVHRRSTSQETTNIGKPEVKTPDGNRGVHWRIILGRILEKVDGSCGRD